MWLSVTQVESRITFPITNCGFVVKLLSELFLRRGSNTKHKVGVVFYRSSPVIKRFLTWANLMLFLILTSAEMSVLAIVVRIRGQNIS